MTDDVYVSFAEHFPALCGSCGRDTTPCGAPRFQVCRGECGLHVWEWYMVRDEVWRRVTVFPRPPARFLCIGCLERRLGRPLTFDDLTDAPVNLTVHPWDSPRLAAIKTAGLATVTA